MKKVFVLMSGGVDSSVAALLLKKKGYQLIGIHLKISRFCNPQDEYDARRVAEILNIPFYVIDISEDYQREIALQLIKEYALGYTPNPDVWCNQIVKFGFVYEKLRSLGFNYIATGHYARIKNNLICLPKDKNKDQTYFLWGIKKDILKNIIFPLGDYTKNEIRKIAKRFGLPNYAKKDSQGICFLGKISLRDFLKEYLPEAPGLIVNQENLILGHHPGYWFFTEGQRHGLNIKDGKGPYYVALKDPKENKIIVARENEEILYCQKIKIRDLNWFLELPPKTNKFLIRCRYRQPLTPAYFDYPKSEVIFAQPIKGVAPGQSIVFYSQQYLIGGGIIEKRL